MDSPGTLGRLINGAPGLAKLQAEILGKAAHAGNEPEKASTPPTFCATSWIP